MAKPEKQVIINAIIKEIELGKARGYVLARISKKWQLSTRVFDRLWKTANEQQHERQQKAKEAADAAYISASADAAKKAVMSSQERKELLTKIAKGTLLTKAPNPKNPKQLIDVPVIIETTERIKAISELNKMEGDYAPTKVAQTTTDGKDLDLSKLPISFA